MNPRARRIRRQRRLYRVRVDYLTRQAGKVPVPEYADWDFATDVVTWGSSRIPLRVVRQRRWSRWYGKERLSADAARRLAAMFGPRLSYAITAPAHPTWEERSTRILRAGPEP